MLQFNSENQFRILILADIQAFQPLDTRKQFCIRALINHSAPELVVLLGDMLCGLLMITERRVRSVIQSIMEPITESGIPFVFVSGNHDTDARVTLEQQIRIYHEYPGCLMPLTADRSCPGAYDMTVSTPDSGKTVRLLFFDSGATRISLQGIQYLPADRAQLDYTERELALNDSQAFVFQHVPVPEIYHLLDIQDQSGEYTVLGKGPYRGKFLSLHDRKSGILGEAPCPSWENTKQFEGWIKSGKVTAAVFGHDHKNSFTGMEQGITFIQVSCAGLSCYGTDSLRGGQLLTLYSDGRWETEALYYRNVL